MVRKAQLEVIADLNDYGFLVNTITSDGVSKYRVANKILLH